MSTVTVRFRRFWPSFDPQSNFFTKVLSRVSGVDDLSVVHDRRTRVDLEICSVFQTPGEAVWRRVTSLTQRGARSGDAALRATVNGEMPSDLARRSFWFTGENIRPPAAPWDGFGSYDLDTLGGRNVYFPLWMQQLDWFGAEESLRLGAALKRNELLSPRIVDWSQRPKFCCAFIGNDHPMRQHVIQALRAYGDVDIFGRAVGRPVSDKMSVASQYRFAVCLENDLYPGYVTEKPVEAWRCGTVPIYWGADPAGYLNRAAMLNLADYPDIQSLVDEVVALDSDPVAGEAVANAPILTSAPALEPLLDKFHEMLNP